MRIDIISIFPDYFAALQVSLVGKAITAGLLETHVHDLRDWTHDRHRTVDDTPYGGGAGMVMKPEPWGEALGAVLEESSTAHPGGPVLIIPSPSGERFTQSMAAEFSTLDHLVLACGRYEGIDHRVIEWAGQHFQVREVSLGDYVLNGGEVAGLAIIEAVARLIPGIIGNPESLLEESYSQASGGLLEYPVYTKPQSWQGLEVPPVLLSGNHQQIAEWRRQRSLELTRERRPDLLPPGA